MRRIFVYEVDINKLQELIKKKMYSVDELSRLAGVHYVTIYGMMKKGRARGDTIRKIAKVLEVEPMELVKGGEQ